MRRRRPILAVYVISVRKDKKQSGILFPSEDRDFFSSDFGVAQPANGAVAGGVDTRKRKPVGLSQPTAGKRKSKSKAFDKRFFFFNKTQHFPLLFVALLCHFVRSAS